MIQKNSAEKGDANLPVCVIGAGSSGVAVAKALKEASVPFDCFEVGSKIGGMWRYENDNGMSSAYRSLHLDTSRKNLGYSDFPIPDHHPDFLSHAEVLKYLEDYANHFDVTPLISFNSRVEKVEPLADKTWRVTVNGQAKRYRAVIVANGHLWDPRWGQFDGQFDGEQLHSHHYRTAEQFAGKNVLVIGIGNSAVDVAVDVCKSAKSTFLSTRSSAWIMPKYIMGIPTDRWSSFFGKKLRLPTRVTRTLVKWLAYLVVGDQERFGVPRPKHPIWREHATLSQELLPFCGHGWIRVKPNVKRFVSNEVEFVNGHTEQIDAVIHATGYKISFPFLDSSLFDAESGKVDLYRRMLVPDQPGLFMLGLVQPIGPTIPLVEIQSKWLAAVLSGHTLLPSTEVMEREIESHRYHQKKRYLGSVRYLLEVDFRKYAKQLFSDISRRRAGA